MRCEHPVILEIAFMVYALEGGREIFMNVAPLDTGY